MLGRPPCKNLGNATSLDMIRWMDGRWGQHFVSVVWWCVSITSRGNAEKMPWEERSNPNPPPSSLPKSQSIAIYDLLLSIVVVIEARWDCIASFYLLLGDLDLQGRRKTWLLEEIKKKVKQHPLAERRMPLFARQPRVMDDSHFFNLFNVLFFLLSLWPYEYVWKKQYRSIFHCTCIYFIDCYFRQSLSLLSLSLCSKDCPLLRKNLQLGIPRTIICWIVESCCYCSHKEAAIRSLHTSVCVDVTVIPSTKKSSQDDAWLGMVAMHQRNKSSLK